MHPCFPAYHPEPDILQITTRKTFQSFLQNRLLKNNQDIDQNPRDKRRLSLLYVTAGGKDKIAHPDDVVEAIDHVGSRWADGEIIPEYGHLDLNLGKNAKRDVYPVVQRELIKISRRL